MSVRPLIKAVSMSLFLLLAMACTAEQPVVDLSAPSFDRSPVFRLNVNEVKVVDEYQPPFNGNHVEHLFTTSPARGVGIWATDRLAAAGPQGIAEVHIKDASVTQTDVEKFDRFDASVAVELRIYDGIHPIAVAEARANASLSKNLKKTDSITKREDLFAQMTRELTASLDRSLDASIRQNLMPYVVTIQDR